MIIIKKSEEVPYFVAEDGAEFPSKFECAKHEYKLFLKDRKKAAEKLRIKDVDLVPPTYDGDHDCILFHWYKIEDITDFNVLNQAYNGELYAPDSYPEIMGVEIDISHADIATRGWYLSSIIEDINCFCEKFGYEVTENTKNDYWEEKR